MFLYLYWWSFGLIHSRFSLFKGNGDNFKGRQLFQNYFGSFWKGVCYKRKEFAPNGSKFFPFGVDIFSKRIYRARKQAGSHKSCHTCLKTAEKFSQVFPVTLKDKFWLLVDVSVNYDEMARVFLCLCQCGIWRDCSLVLFLCLCQCGLWSRSSNMDLHCLQWIIIAPQ